MSSAVDNEPDYTEKISLLEKLISSDRLTYLPNLYYRQYRLMEMLTNLRSNFPSQKVLIPRENSRNDYLIEEVKMANFQRVEEIKRRKAVCFHLAKCAKDEHLKRQYKKEETNLFHRVAMSQLAEAVRGKFLEESSRLEKKEIANGNGKVMNDTYKIDKQHKHNDGIFIGESESPIANDAEDGDLFDDFLKEQNQEPEVNMNDSKLIRTTSDYIETVIQSNNLLIKSNQSQINRKLCFKKINENLRKRNKAKTDDDSTDRKISSATVAITNLINQEPENKVAEEMIEVPSENEHLAQETRSKKRKDEQFELKWSEENLETFSTSNSRFDISKGKFDDNYLSISLEKNEKDYEKMFEKNIGNAKTFPPSIKSIPSLRSKFSKNYYYNKFPDADYEEFVISHSKRKIFEKFRKTAPYVLSDSYSQEYEGESINFAKLFVSSDGPYSDRIIYKINNNHLTSVSSLPNKSPLTKEELSQLAYFVRKYLGLFGSNWKLIHLFISIHPPFSKMSLTKELIQDYHQIPRKKDSKQSLDSLQLLDSKVLPFSIYNAFGYEQYRRDMPMENIEENTAMDAETEEEQRPEFNFDKYEEMLDQPLKSHENPKEYVFDKTAKNYEQFAKGLMFPIASERRVDLVEDIDRVIAEFEHKVKIVEADNKETLKSNWCYEWVPEKMKNKIKPITPFRKRKSISEKFSELVTILHRLKQRLQAPATTRPPMPPQGVSRAPSTVAENRVAPTTSQITESNNNTNKKMLPRQNKDTTSAPKSAANQPKPRKSKKKGGNDDDDK